MRTQEFNGQAKNALNLGNSSHQNSKSIAGLGIQRNSDAYGVPGRNASLGRVTVHDCPRVPRNGESDHMVFPARPGYHNAPTATQTFLTRAQGRS